MQTRMIDRVGQAGLVGLRGRAGARAAEWVGERTRLDARTLQNLVGLAVAASLVWRLGQIALRARHA